MLLPLIPEELDDRTVRRDVALQDHEPAGLLDRLIHRMHDILSRSLLGVGGGLGEGLAGDGHGVTMHEVRIDHALGHHRGAAREIEIERGVLSARHHVAEEWSAPGNLIEVIDGQRNARLTRKPDQVKHAVRGAAAGSNSGNRVLKRLPGQDVLRQKAARKNIHDQLADFLADSVLALIDSRCRGRTHRRKADELHRHGHGVRRVLAATGARARAGDIFQLGEFFVTELASGVGPNRLVNGANRHFLVMPVSGHDGATVEQHRRNVQTNGRHREPGKRLVTGADADNRIEHVATRYQLNRVGDDLARNQRGLHALGAHRDTVRDRDGVQFLRRATGRADPFLDVLCQLTLVQVARHGLDPAMGHANDRALEIIVIESGPLEHCPGPGSIVPIEDHAALVPHVKGCAVRGCRLVQRAAHRRSILLCRRWHAPESGACRKRRRAVRRTLCQSVLLVSVFGKCQFGCFTQRANSPAQPGPLLR